MSTSAAAAVSLLWSRNPRTSTLPAKRQRLKHSCRTSRPRERYPSLIQVCVFLDSPVVCGHKISEQSKVIYHRVDPDFNVLPTPILGEFQLQVFAAWPESGFSRPALRIALHDLLWTH